MSNIYSSYNLQLSRLELKLFYKLLILKIQSKYITYLCLVKVVEIFGAPQFDFKYIA